jgi:ABC-type nitrate/sulfonate/bicarbonate transport system permease component
MKKVGNRIIIITAPFVVLVIILAICELIARSGTVADYILPAPSVIIKNTVVHFPNEILPDFLFSLKVIAVGFVSATVAGIALAALFSQYEIITKAVTPGVILLVVTPMITLIPLIMLWLGNNPNIRIIIVVVQATPIITLNTLTGFTTIETEKIELAKSVGCTKWQLFSKIIFMNAMPQVFTGIKLGCIFSIIGSVSADFVAKSVGLGNRIIQYTKYVNADLTYGCIIIIALIGIILYQIINLIEKHVVVWKN